VSTPTPPPEADFAAVDAYVAGLEDASGIGEVIKAYKKMPSAIRTDLGQSWDKADADAQQDAARAARWRALVESHRERLIEAAIYSMADIDCDLSNGDTYDDKDYRPRADYAVNAVLEYLSWTPELITPDASVGRVRSGTSAAGRGLDSLGLAPLDGDALTHLNFAELQRTSVLRCLRWHGPDSEPWSGADWSNAMCGEAGEAANVVKKLRRLETGTAAQDQPAALDGVDLGAAVIGKFNAVSEREGFSERIGETRVPKPLPCDQHDVEHCEICAATGVDHV
jgi:ribosomal protein L12E/L44/L45/RPP1/RPP2